MGSSARAGLVVGVVLLAAAGGVVVSQLRSGPRPVTAAAIQPTSPVPEAVFSCGACHGVPPPSALPRSKWESVITMMKQRIDAYGLTPAPSDEQVKAAIAYYLSAAPESLPALHVKLPASAIMFAPAGFGSPAVQGAGPPPVIGHLRVVDLDQNHVPDVLVCDTTAGRVVWMAQRPDGAWVETTVGMGTCPSHAEVVDLDHDGRAEIVFSTLGGLTPTDDPVGTVEVVRNDGRGNAAQERLLSGAPRVSDVRAADLDGDGDTDLAVAMFGMYATGGIGWLERTAPGSYELRTIERICGVSHVPVGDLDGDGRPDIAALVSQHHERIIVCFNRGGGKFDERVVYQAAHPLWGLSGIELVDLNKDGRLDILFTNGDALDFDTAPKPYHGVQWLENVGEMKFAYHDIARLYGAYRAVAADLDGDGDLDVVVSSMTAPWQNEDAQSLVWFENDGRQGFSARGIANSPTSLVSIEVADFNGDGRPDIIAGGMYVMRPYGRVGRITMWTNMGTRR